MCRVLMFYRLLALKILIFLLTSVVGLVWTSRRERIHVKHIREATLKEGLYSIRNAIDQFTQDHDRCPASLDDLAQAGYFTAIPKDPLTNSSTTWQLIYEEHPILQPGPGTSPKKVAAQQCLVDIRSGSKDVAKDGKPYSDW
jgi:general secretion pathway protein G